MLSSLSIPCDSPFAKIHFVNFQYLKFKSLKKYGPTSTDDVCVFGANEVVCDHWTHLWPFSTFFIFGKIVGNTFVICLRWVFYGLTILRTRLLRAIIAQTKRSQNAHKRGKLNIIAKSTWNRYNFGLCIHNIRNSQTFPKNFYDPGLLLHDYLSQMLFDYRKEIGQPVESKYRIRNIKARISN